MTKWISIFMILTFKKYFQLICLCPKFMNLLSKNTKAITMRFYDLFSMHILKEAQYNVYFNHFEQSNCKHKTEYWFRKSSSMRGCHWCTLYNLQHLGEKCWILHIYLVALSQKNWHAIFFRTRKIPTHA